MLGMTLAGTCAEVAAPSIPLADVTWKIMTYYNQPANTPYDVTILVEVMIWLCKQSDEVVIQSLGLSSVNSRNQMH